MTTNIRSETVPIQSPIVLKRKLPLQPILGKRIVQWRQEINNILTGKDQRMLVIIGPCSVHDTDAVETYAQKLFELQKKCTNLFFVMRTYFEKPRTRKGWSGFLHDPYLDGSNNMQMGLFLTRKLLIDLTTLGIPCATETLSLIAPQYIDDLISFACIGARTTESQPHRELASGLSAPVGFKNSTTGSVSAAVNAIHSAAEPKSFMGITEEGRAAVVHTKGNNNCCLILRGGTQPNYKHNDIQQIVEQLKTEEMKVGILVDASHGNSGKDWEQQINVVDYLIAMRHPSICGIMVESFLQNGKQSLQNKEFGVSVTDSCIGWDMSEQLMIRFNASQKVGYKYHCESLG